jgi:hypothetical protein
MRSIARTRLGVVLALAQRGGEQARRVQRLQQVVAGRREEAGLRQVGRLRIALGLAQGALDAVAQLDLAEQARLTSDSSRVRSCTRCSSVS